MPTASRPRPTRRTVLQTGLTGLTGWAGLWGPRPVPASEAVEAAADDAALNCSADAVLFLNLAGGPSHLDTLDMKPDAPAETRGEFSAIDTKLPGLRVCEHLPKFAAVADRFTLIRGIAHTTGDHPQGQAYIASGNRPSPALKYPSYGSVAVKERPGAADLPPYVAIPQTEWTAGYMGDAYGPFSTNAVPEPGRPFAVRGLTLSGGLTVETLNRRQALLKDLDTRFRDAEAESELLAALDTFGDQAHGMITSARTSAAFDVGREPESIRRRFAEDELGQSLLLALRLIAFGVRFVTVTNGGWDTHLDNFTGHRKLLGPFDAGLTAVVAALEEKGLLERTLVVAMGEFGRTPKVNANVGRDHYPRANWCLMAGGGVRPGRLIGGTDRGGTGPDDATDVRPDDLGASIFNALGIDHHKEYYTRTDRPVSLIPYGRVIRQLFE